MISHLVEQVSTFILQTIRAGGYAGVVGLMAIESACIPLPSELIMPFAGFLASEGRFSVWLLAVVGSAGCVLGSIPAYYAGYYGGRPLIEKYGKWVLLSHHDLDMADRLFERHGEPVIFFGRMLPVVRTFIAFPAGVSRMKMGRFLLYTFLGSLPWCLALAFVGLKLGDHWEVLGKYFHEFDALIGVCILVAVGLFLYRHLRRPRPAAGNDKPVSSPRQSR